MLIRLAYQIIYNESETVLDFAMISKENLVKILANTLIGLVLVFLWLRIVNLNEVLDKLSQINLIYAIPFIGFFMLANFLRATRLKMLLNEYQIPRINLMALNYLSQLLSFLVPLRLGEFAKGIYLSNQYKINFSKALVWILLDRFLDFWMVLVTSLLILFVIPTQLPENIRSFLPLVVLALTIGSGFVIYFPQVAKKLVRLTSVFLAVMILKKYFIRLSDFLIDTASFLKRGSRESLSILVLTFFAVLADSLTLYVLFVSLFDAPDPLKVILGANLSALTFLIPAAPGYVGSVQAYAVAIFSLGLGYDASSVSAISLVMHALTILCMLTFGISSVYFLKFDLSLIKAKLMGKALKI